MKPNVSVCARVNEESKQPRGDGLFMNGVLSPDCLLVPPVPGSLCLGHVDPRIVLSIVCVRVCDEELHNLPQSACV